MSNTGDTTDDGSVTSEVEISSAAKSNVKVAAKKEKRGVIYLPSIPDGMNPSNARLLLSKYGEIDRIYFEPERYRRGIPYAYKEGWVEYKKKRVAKMVANTLNGQVISAKKKSPFAEAIWTMKYLHRFKWHHLNEQVAFDQKSKEQRLRMELSRVRKEADFYSGQMMKLKKMQKTKCHEKTLDAHKVKSRSNFYQKKQLPPVQCSEKGLDSSLLERIFTS